MQVLKTFTTQSECSEHYINDKVNAVNPKLMNRCKNYGVGRIDNSNIKIDFSA